MNKRTFQIPEGCKAVTFEQTGNTIITTFEPAQPEFKRGDVVYCSDNDGFNWVFVFDEKANREFNPYNYFVSVLSLGKVKFNDYCRHPEFEFRHATPEEAQRLWDALAKDGKRWNSETMKVEEIKNEIPRAESGKGSYYFFESSTSGIFGTRETNHRYDNARHEIGNYFLTKEQAQRAADKLKQALTEFWKEELK